VQDAFLRAWRHYADFRGGDERPWLLTIVRNCCYTWRRSQRTHDDVPYEDDRHGLHESARSATDAKAVAASQREMLAAALAALAPEFREAVVLREIQGFSYREIAEITGVPIGTVMSRLARSREQLRRSLQRSA
jgi:RNA polymerase sigma-70 factor (ECF subfamily)